jgi:hypothetical protein
MGPDTTANSAGRATLVKTHQQDVSQRLLKNPEAVNEKIPVGRLASGRLSG